MKVSVILPIYNGEKTLAATLDSLANQTFSDFELVACIDGTYDGSQKILEEYRSRFSELRILQNKRNHGLGRTMNRLVSEARGHYIAVAEQDDFYYPERLKLEVEVLDTNQDVGLVSGIAEFWDGEKVTTHFPGMLYHGKAYPEGEEFFLLNYRKQLKVVNSAMMFRKSVHIDNGLYFTQHHPSISVDWTYILRFGLLSNVVGLQQVLVRIDRSRERNSVTTNKPNQFRATRKLIRDFWYEYPDLVKKSDYLYALNTQRLLELGHKKGVGFIALGLFYFLISGNKRFLNKIMNRVTSKMR